jgi:hypothetical protein
MLKQIGNGSRAVVAVSEALKVDRTLPILSCIFQPFLLLVGLILFVELSRTWDERLIALEVIARSMTMLAV